MLSPATMTTSTIGNKLRGFTFLELLAVLVLMGVVLFMSGSYFFSKSLALKAEAKQLTKDIQTVYIRTIRSGEIHRINFLEDKMTYVIEAFELPPPPPTPEEEEAYEKWQEEQREKNKELQSLSRDERRARTQIDQGKFVEVERRTLEDPVQLSDFYVGGAEESEDSEERFLMFYPSGEMSHALIHLDGGDGRFYSLATNSLSGRVTVLAGRLSKANWQKKVFEAE